MEVIQIDVDTFRLFFSSETKKLHRNFDSLELTPQSPL